MGKYFDRMLFISEIFNDRYRLNYYSIIKMWYILLKVGDVKQVIHMLKIQRQLQPIGCRVKFFNDFVWSDISVAQFTSDSKSFYTLSW